jgi:type IV pilus assembly protein PilX
MNRRTTSFRSGPQRQKGAVLVIALIMLLVITLASIATIRSTTLDERMAGNSRDRDKALQAAEAAVRVCLKQLTVDIPSTFTGTILPPVLSGTENWDVAANWASGSPNSVEVDMTAAAGLSSNPRCMVERLGTGDNYRVTGRAVGGSDSSVVIIQATYSADA